MAGTVQIRDAVIWFAHISGAPQIVQMLDELSPGQEVVLLVDGWEGAWIRMMDGKNGRRTRGIRPGSSANSHWRTLYPEQRYSSVTISGVS
ncbi:hypothetical protein [Paracoccus sp. IB05]|uniref:hypothetical protein n=1 Tax=Paracoccus sp. IB05 TaxID=2779367 RepID=UPI0018E8751B|nr:hypothetical protein [Paracoccus sp. IB05]MBJ2153787.1 hypothetical protein [Paracoccus sp. IB05]